MAWRYVIALGSNVRHHRHGAPRHVLKAALAALDAAGLAVIAAAPIAASAPVGPSIRRYANGAAMIETALDPADVLSCLQRIESAFGRRRRGQRWGARVLDLDIVLWNGGAFAAADLVIPHVAFRGRGFVLGPAAQIAAQWRDPVSGRTLRQLAHALARPCRALDRVPRPH